MRFAVLFLGIFAIGCSEGRPNNLLVKTAVDEMTQSIVHPLLAKTQDADKMLSEVLKAYNDKMALLGKKISHLEKGGLGGDTVSTTSAPTVTTSAPVLSTTPDPHSCQELSRAVKDAQGVTNDAALLALKVVGDLSEVLLSSEDCITINIFRAASCSAHKLKDVKDIYLEYKPQLVQAEQEMGKALKKVGKEFVACFKQVDL